MNSLESPVVVERRLDARISPALTTDTYPPEPSMPSGEAATPRPEANPVGTGQP